MSIEGASIFSKNFVSFSTSSSFFGVSSGFAVFLCYILNIRCFKKKKYVSFSNFSETIDDVDENEKNNPRKKTVDKCEYRG